MRGETSMYKKDETTEKVLSVIKNYFDENGIDAKNLNEKSNLMKDYDLDSLDSLDYLELFDNLEEEFDIQVFDNMKDYNTLLSVDQLVQYVILNKKNVQN